MLLTFAFCVEVAVIMALPSLMPVTTPVELTLAILLSLDDQVTLLEAVDGTTSKLIVVVSPTSISFGLAVRIISLISSLVEAFTSTVKLVLTVTSFSVYVHVTV